MTDTRLAALEAVATRVRIWCASRFDLDGDGATRHDTQALFDALAALDALDALPAQPPGETVTLAVWEDMSSGVVALVVPSSDCDDPEPNCRRLGTVTLEVTP